MPPASRGWHPFTSIRFASSSKPPAARKPRLPAHRVPPIEGRPRPRPKAPEPLIATDSTAQHTARVQRSAYQLLLERIPPRYRLLKRLPHPWRIFIFNTLLFVPIGLWVAINFPLKVMSTNGPSMSPFLNPNSSNGELPVEKQRILVKHLGLSLTRRMRRRTQIRDMMEGTGLSRGQVVVFTSPMDPSRTVVKRIVGIAGDRVQPLKGYAGGDDPVVVPYNQVWVEGDIGDRDKSVDSNWYGPISAELATGEVVAVLEPWWKPTWVQSDYLEYPAKREDRVEENAVQAAMEHPNNVARTSAFLDGKALSDLNQMKADMPNTIRMIQASHNTRVNAIKLYRGARAELLRDDANTKDLARELIETLEQALVKAGYEQEDLKANALPKWVASEDLQSWEQKEQKLRRELPAPTVSTVKVEVLPSPNPPEKVEDLGPASKALKEYWDQVKRDKEAGVSNGLDKPERFLMWQDQERVLRERAERKQAEKEARFERERLERDVWRERQRAGEKSWWPF